MSYDIKNIVQINKNNAEPAVQALVNAFKNYPIFQHYFPKEKNRINILHYLLSFSVYSGIKYGKVYATTSNLEGVAIWIPSNNYPITTWKMLRSVSLLTTLNVVRCGGYKMKHFSDYIDKVHRGLAPSKHWFLQAMGIDPKYQGKGYASKLLRPMLSKIDQEYLPCYLETIEERNVSIYEHFGFKTIDKTTVPKTNFTSWAMLRKSQ
jgi:GNAT superfamily N-acetyltransferase